MNNLRSILLFVVGVVSIICGVDLAFRMGMFQNYIPEPPEMDLEIHVIHH